MQVKRDPLILLTLFLVGLGSYLTMQGIVLIPATRGSPRTTSLVGFMAGWNYSQPSGSNPQITAFQGESLTAKLSSGDGYTHQFVVDVDNDGGDASDCNVDLCSAGFTTSTIPFSFSANFPGGTYMYYCSVHPMTMFGKFVVQDFGFTSSPSSLTLAQGTNATASVSVASLGGLRGQINLTASVSPMGLGATLNPTSIQLPVGGSASSTITVSSTGVTPAEVYTIKLGATNGNISHSVSLTVVVQAHASPAWNLPAWAIPGIAGVIAVGVAAVLVARHKTLASRHSSSPVKPYSEKRIRQTNMYQL